jgi:hypothetical protein
MKIALLCCYLFLNLIAPIFGQGIVTSTPEAFTRDLSSPGSAYALILYDSTTLESQNLYNGQQYHIYDSQSEEHPFYLSREWVTGSVFYDGQLFDSVPLLYDIVKDQLVVKYTKSFGKVSLQGEKVSHFYLSEGKSTGHTFIRLEAGQRAGIGMRTGFYDLIYDGTSSVITRRVKVRQQTISDTKVIIGFPYKEVFYLYARGEYHPVATRKSVLALMADQKRPLNKYLREQKIKFRKNKEGAILALAYRYDQLSKP